MTQALLAQHECAVPALRPSMQTIVSTSLCEAFVPDVSEDTSGA